MLTSKRTLLIVEDDQVLNTLYKIHCDEALKAMPHVAGTVEQAFSYSQAQQILGQQPVDFISVDIALSKEEEGKSEEEREEQEVAGMMLLKQLQRATRQPLAVIVSGETLLSYALDAYRKYGVLAFYQKTRFNNEEYIQAVQAALWYLDAAELIEKPRIEAALHSWQQALAAARRAGIKEQQFPEAIGQKIETGWTHAVTELPIGRWTEEKLRDQVVEQNNWSLIRVTIQEFSRFVSMFASQEEPILSFVGNLLKQMREVFPVHEIFIGHLGHLEYTPEPHFVVVLDQQNREQAEQMAAWLKDEFAKRDQVFAPTFPNNASQPPPELMLETKILTSSEETFEDLHRLLDVLGSGTAG